MTASLPPGLRFVPLAARRTGGGRGYRDAGGAPAAGTHVAWALPRSSAAAPLSAIALGLAVLGGFVAWLTRSAEGPSPLDDDVVRMLLGFAGMVLAAGVLALGLYVVFRPRSWVELDAAGLRGPHGLRIPIERIGGFTVESRAARELTDAVSAVRARTDGRSEIVLDGLPTPEHAEAVRDHLSTVLRELRGEDRR